MVQTVDLKKAGVIGLDLVGVIQANRERLGDIDGAIGDGDHGINMAKGFRMAGERMGETPEGLAEAFETISDTLLGDIGGSMGPLYGTFFSSMAETLDDKSVLTAKDFSAMLKAGVEAVIDLGGAKPGDKSLIDVLVPASTAFDTAIDSGANFASALEAAAKAGEDGLESTRDMVARIGRAARLGERSRGALDAGAASSALIITTLATGLIAHMDEAA